MHDPYRQPIPPVSGHPGMTLNKGWGWKWTGRYRLTQKVEEFYIRTNFGGKGELADYVSHHYPGIEYIDATEADREPTVVFPLQPHAFQNGILDAIAGELTDMGRDRSRSSLRTLNRDRPVGLRRLLTRR